MIWHNLCPVTAILAARGPGPGPLFILDKWFLTREAFVAAIRAALREAGLIARDYAGHSFKIGAATTTARQGLQDSLIKTLGRWEEFCAYTKFIRTAPETLRGMASRLTSSLSP